MDGVMVVTDD